MITTKLRLKLAERNMSQSELARVTGIRQPAISAYCNNTYKQISKEHLDILCKFFNCDINDILEFKDENKKDPTDELIELFSKSKNVIKKKFDEYTILSLEDSSSAQDNDIIDFLKEYGKHLKKNNTK